MLILRNVTIKDNKNHTLIENLNYSVGMQDKIGIIGEEGNGKSTLLKAIYNKNLIHDYAVMSGTIDTDIKHMGYFAQQLDDAWDNDSPYEYLLKEEPNGEIPFEKYNELQDFENLCAQMHLRSDILETSQKIFSLSGGEKVKLRMAKLMHAKIDLLLLDEPTNDLDLETLRWMESFLLDLHIPVLFISHDETLLSRCANVIVHLEQRNKKTKCHVTIFKGTYPAYISQRKTKLQKDVQIAQKEKQEYRKKKEKLNNQMNAVRDALNDTVRNPKQGALLKNKMKNIKAMEKRFEKESYAHVDSVEEAIHVFFEKEALPREKRILDITTKEIRIQERLLLKPQKLLIKGNDKIAFIGNNGCGKSLLLKQLYEILRDRDDIVLGYMPQNYMEELSQYEHPVSFLMEEGNHDDVSRCRELLGAMKFTSEEMLHSMKELSEGQKAKLFLLRFIKRKCNVLLLDEPTRNLSPLSNPVIRDILIHFQGCMISISHDRCFLQEVCETIYEFQEHELHMIEKEAL